MNTDSILYENKDYPPCPTGCAYSLSYPSSLLNTPTPEPCMYESPGYCSSSSSSVSNTSSAPTTPEPENSSLVASTSKTPMTSNKKPAAPKKQYQCTQCLKNFSRPSALQTHSYTHTSEKPFQCLSPGCGRRFSVVSNLRRHFKVHQKPSVGNKLSSEDRLRYVRQLIKTSDTILARQQQQQQQEEQAARAQQYNNKTFKETVHTSSDVQQQDPTSIYRYQHYLLLPAINTNNSHSGFSPLVADSNTTAAVDHHHSNNNNYLFGSSMLGLPCSWSNQISSEVDQTNNSEAIFNNQNHNQNFTDNHHLQHPSSVTSNNQPSLFSYLGFNYTNNNESSLF